MASKEKNCLYVLLCLLRYLHNCRLCHLLVGRRIAGLNHWREMLQFHNHVKEEPPPPKIYMSPLFWLANREAGVQSALHVHKLASVSWLKRKHWEFKATVWLRVANAHNTFLASDVVPGDSLCHKCWSFKWWYSLVGVKDLNRIIWKREP